MTKKTRKEIKELEAKYIRGELEYKDYYTLIMQKLQEER